MRQTNLNIEGSRLRPWSITIAIIATSALALFAAPVRANTYTLTCGKPTKGGSISLTVRVLIKDLGTGTENFESRVFTIGIPEGVDAATKCDTIRDELFSGKIGLFSVNVAENQLRLVGFGFSTTIRSNITDVIVTDDTDESTALTANAPPGTRTAVAQVPVPDQGPPPAAGTQFQVAVVIGNVFCTASVTADGTTGKSALLNQIDSALNDADTLCNLNSSTYIDPHTNATGSRGAFVAGPSTVISNANFATLASLAVLTQPPATPATNNADFIVSPSSGASLLLPFPISITNNGNNPHIVRTTYYFGSPDLAQSSTQTMPPGATTFSLIAPLNNARNVEVTVCTVEGSSCLTAVGSTATYALARACAFPSSAINPQFVSQAFDNGQGFLRVHYLLHNEGSSPITGPLAAAALLVTATPPSTQPAPLVNADGSVTLGCPFGGFPKVTIPLPTPLQPGQSLPVQLQIPIPEPTVQNTTINPIIFRAPQL